MSLSWNEIRARAGEFALEWKDERSEDAEAKSFWDDFFKVFGTNRRRLASFEQAVKKLDGRTGFIDLFWPGTLLVEHKSRGKSLEGAFSQATDYFHGLKDHELPKFVLVSDFARLKLYDLDAGTDFEFALEDLPREVERFGFIAGYQQRVYRDADPVNQTAALEMAALHDELERSGYTGHKLEVLLVRLLFCLFADSTGIFERGIFYDLIEGHTSEDGANLGMVLGQLFEVLDTATESRQSTLDERYTAFPYVNGQLFSESLRMVSFDTGMREKLLSACAMDWGRISPAIFGTLFQAAMSADERRRLGAHYTSEANILKALGPLFLDALQAEREAARGNRNRLVTFLERLRRIRFLDPACGCGSFLILAYRELRRLELDAVLERLNFDNQRVLDIASVLFVNLEQVHGIELDEFPAQIAQVALWLTDHQMNLEAGERLGSHFLRLPLPRTIQIQQGDALALDWAAVLDLERTYPQLEAVYIVGNPPFIGSKYQSEAQRETIKRIFTGVRDNGILDYVTGWFHKSAALMREWHTRAPLLTLGSALVSTNSITQGEQVAPLWSTLLGTFRMYQTFAHRTFSWTNEARGRAAVHCVIVGFAPTAPARPRLFEYASVSGPALEAPVTRLNPYLVDGPSVMVEKSGRPLSDVPEIHFGNMPLDGGHLLMTPEERDELLRLEPQAAPYIRPLLDAQDFLNGGTRYCLWLEGIDPSALRRMPRVLERVEKVKVWRLASIAPSTQRFAATPSLFRDRRLPETYLVLPKASSSRRDYLPIGYQDNSTVVNDLLFIISNPNRM